VSVFADECEPIRTPQIDGICFGLHGGGENLRKIWIIAAGVLALGMVVALALVGVSPNGAYAWHSIQTAMNSVSDVVVKSNGAYAWH
jgi:hypothetical protein